MVGGEAPDKQSPLQLGVVAGAGAAAARSGHAPAVEAAWVRPGGGVTGPVLAGAARCDWAACQRQRQRRSGDCPADWLLDTGGGEG